jgi:hypothetical protein
MPPTLKLSALVAFAAHLSLVKVCAGAEEDSEGVEEADVDALAVSLALASGSSSSDPHAANERARMAVDAVTFAQVRVLDRFTW